MLDSTQSWNLFGYDVRQPFLYFQAGWRDFLWGHNSPVRDALDEVVTVHDEQRNVRCLRAGVEVASQETQSSAIVLPDELVLHRTLSIPAAAEANLDAVLNMEVSANSPFPVDDTCFGWRIARHAVQMLDVSLVITARSAVMEYIAKHFDTHDTHTYEVWARDGDGVVVLQGFGEEARRSRYRAQLWRGAGVLAYCVGILVLGIAISTGLKYLEVQKVEKLFEETRQSAAQGVRMREQLTAGNELVDTANALMRARPDLFAELTALSGMLEDDTFVSSVDVKGRVIRIEGQSPNASKVMQKLTDEERYSSVSAPVAIRKVPRSEMERFVLQLELASTPITTGEDT